MAERLAVVCAHFEEIRSDLLAEIGDDSSLQELLRAIRTDEEIPSALEALHTALRAGGDALGLRGYAEDGTVTRGLRPVGISGGASGGGDALGGEITYICPTRRCARFWWPQGPTALPECAITGAPLRRERL
ncbi:hypothetical protein ABZ154_31905 [Streptomyces sp. NPDC006261]|uniref:hypothetical protein n=1 Tax=Streptomyces sp. NPDC006261 TaxID=3156739 RepID=UPI0033BF32BC